MAQKDFRKNRFRVALRGIKIFLQEKSKIAPDTFFSLFITGKQTMILAELSQNSGHILKQLHSKKFIKNHELKGKSSEIIYTLEMAFENIDLQLKKIGDHKSRILILSGDFVITDEQLLEKLLQKAQALQIRIDILILNKDLPEKLAKHYKNITSKTNGLFYNYKKRQSFYKGVTQYALDQHETPVYIQLVHPKEKTKEEHLAEIALFLRKPTEAEFNQIMSRSQKPKCQICFSKPSTLQSFSTKSTLRFCPHCDTPMHLYCAGLWSIKTQEKAQLFRCPYCYTLLKIPKHVRKGLLTREKWKNISNKQLLVKMIRIQNDEINNMLHQKKTEQLECNFCFQSLEDKTKTSKIFRCSKCGAFYHIECLKKMYEYNKCCFNCNGKIV